MCWYHALVSILARLHALHPFQTRAAQRLAMLFAVVYFSQGMYYVFAQPLTLFLKETLGLSATQIATFGWITLLPWVIKPLYGFLSDSVPLFGYRRKSYFILSCAVAAVAGLLLAARATPTYWTLAVFVTAMAFGVAFTDVLTDAMMVESGKPLGLTGAFQSVQWAGISVATILVGLAGGYFAHRRNLQGAVLAPRAVAAQHRVVDRGGRRRHPRLPALSGFDVRRHHRHDVRRHRHDDAARVPRPRGEGVPQARGGNVLRALDVGLQPRHAGITGHRRLALRLDPALLAHRRLHAARPDLRR